MSSLDPAFAGSSFLYNFFFCACKPSSKKGFCPHYFPGWTVEEPHCPSLLKSPKISSLFLFIDNTSSSPLCQYCPYLAGSSPSLPFLPSLFIVQNCISSLCYFSLCGDPNTATAKPTSSVVLNCSLGQIKFTESAKPGLCFMVHPDVSSIRRVPCRICTMHSSPQVD